MSEHEEKTQDDIQRIIDAGTLVKTFGGWVVGLVAIIISVIFWVQTQGADKYYPKLSGENLEKQFARIEQKFDNLEAGNREIIRMLGHLEAEKDARK
jgi:hypothetical protein